MCDTVVTIERLGKKNEDWAKYIFEHRGIAPFFQVDGMSLRDYPLHQALETESFYFLCPIVDAHRAGIIFFQPVNARIYDCHVLLLPSFRGEVAEQIGRAAIDWMFENTSCHELVAYTRESLRHATIYGLRLGFRVVENVKKLSLKKKGVF